MTEGHYILGHYILLQHDSLVSILEVCKSQVSTEDTWHTQNCTKGSTEDSSFPQSWEQLIACKSKQVEGAITKTQKKRVP